jgi:hypothetical protein
MRNETGWLICISFPFIFFGFGVVLELKDLEMELVLVLVLVLSSWISLSFFLSQSFPSSQSQCGDLSYGGPDGRTPLHLAAAAGQAQVQRVQGDVLFPFFCFSVGGRPFWWGSENVS